jgi:hypothetical protein
MQQSIPLSPVDGGIFGFCPAHDRNEIVNIGCQSPLELALD